MPFIVTASKKRKRIAVDNRGTGTNKGFTVFSTKKEANEVIRKAIKNKKLRNPRIRTF